MLGIIQIVLKLRGRHHDLRKTLGADEGDAGIAGIEEAHGAIKDIETKGSIGFFAGVLGVEAQLAGHHGGDGGFADKLVTMDAGKHQDADFATLHLRLAQAVFGGLYHQLQAVMAGFGGWRDNAHAFNADARIHAAIDAAVLILKAATGSNDARGSIGQAHALRQIIQGVGRRADGNPGGLNGKNDLVTSLQALVLDIVPEGYEMAGAGGIAAIGQIVDHAVIALKEIRQNAHEQALGFINRAAPGLMHDQVIQGFFAPFRHLGADR